MSSVLVLGSTGHIGFDVAIAFLQHGFTVYGQTRSEENAKLLAKNEIIPVIGGSNDTAKWVEVGKKVDVIVEAVGESFQLNVGQNVFQAIKSIVKERPKTIVIYTSGVLTYGDEPNGDIITENSPYSNTHPIMAARIALQNEYLALGATVIQPSFVFGRKGSAHKIFGKLVLDAASDATNTSHTISVSGKPGQYRGFIHSLDLAQIYVLVATNPSKSRGQVFIATTDNISTVELLQSIARAAKYDLKEVKFVDADPTNLFSVFLTISQKLSYQKVSNILGYQPKQPSLIEQPERYFQAWNLSKETQHS